VNSSKITLRIERNIYRDTTNVEQEMYDCKAIIGGHGKVKNGVKKNGKTIPKQHLIDTLQKTAGHGHVPLCKGP